MFGRKDLLLEIKDICDALSQTIAGKSGFRRNWRYNGFNPTFIALQSSAFKSSTIVPFEKIGENKKLTKPQNSKEFDLKRGARLSSGYGVTTGNDSFAFLYQIR